MLFISFRYAGCDFVGVDVTVGVCDIWPMRRVVAAHGPFMSMGPMYTGFREIPQLWIFMYFSCALYFGGCWQKLVPVLPVSRRALPGYDASVLRFTGHE